MALRPPPKFVTDAKMALRDRLKQLDIPATIREERVPGTKLYRLIVVSPKFEPMGFTERQSVVWRIVDEHISKDDQLAISMILTLTPEAARRRTAA